MAKASKYSKPDEVMFLWPCETSCYETLSASRHFSAECNELFRQLTNRAALHRITLLAMSSLFYHGSIKTAAVEQVVAPIASHLCHLVLLCDSVEEPEQFMQLEAAAQVVAKATENMAAVASRYVSCGVYRR